MREVIHTFSKSETLVRAYHRVGKSWNQVVKFVREGYGNAFSKRQVTQKSNFQKRKRICSERKRLPAETVCFALGCLIHVSLWVRHFKNMEKLKPINLRMQLIVLLCPRSLKMAQESTALSAP